MRAPRGTQLTCRSWQTEAALRMLMNNLDPDVAEHPDELVVYGGSGRAARSWEAFDDDRAHAAAGSATTRRCSCSRASRSACSARTPDAPRVLIANSNLVGRWANWDDFRELEAKGLIMYGQMTAGSWIYIGTQGILQGTYETFAELARRSTSAATSRGRLRAHRGARRHGRRAAARGHDERRRSRSAPRSTASRIERRARDALPRRGGRLVRRRDGARGGGARGEARGLHRRRDERGRSASSRCWRRSCVPDVVTDQTSAHDLLDGYVPAGMPYEEALALRAAIRRTTCAARCATAVRHVPAMLALQTKGAVVFDYGNNLRGAAEEGGLENAFAFPGFVPAYIRPLFCEGQGAVPLGGALGRSRGHRRHRRGAPRGVPGGRGARALDAARGGAGRVPGSAGAHLLARLRRAREGRAASSTISCATGKVKAPIVIGRDHLDCGSVASPYRETEAMKDGSDAIADWPILNAMLNTASGATWVSFHHGGGVGIGYSLHAGMVIVADGTDATPRRASSACSPPIPGTGVMRHADAGYDLAIEVARERGVDLPGITDR